MKARALLVLCAFLAFTAPASAGGGSFADLALEPHPGARLPLTAELTDEAGNAALLGSFFSGPPVVLVFDYLRCRTICGVLLGNLAAATAAIPPAPRREYTVLAISIDPRDTPSDATAAKAKYLARYPAPLAASFHFLTGSEAAVRPIADAAGFHYRYDRASDQYIHSTGITLAAPDGVIRGYLGEIDVTADALAVALDGTRSGQSVGPLGRFLLLCIGASGVSGRYTPLIEASLMLFNIAAMLAACGLFLWLRRRQHR